MWAQFSPGVLHLFFVVGRLRRGTSASAHPAGKGGKKEGCQNGTSALPEGTNPRSRAKKSAQAKQSIKQAAQYSITTDRPARLLPTNRHKSNQQSCRRRRACNASARRRRPRPSPTARFVVCPPAAAAASSKEGCCLSSSPRRSERRRAAAAGHRYSKRKLEADICRKIGWQGPR